MSTIGQALQLTVFGESHAPVIGMTLTGVPAGEKIDFDALDAFLARRAPGRSAWSTSRHEADKPEFLAGLEGGQSDGTPIRAILRNRDTHGADYAATANVPRPGHADYTAWVKYGAIPPGGGAFSGRMTAPLCIAGGICLQMLSRRGIIVTARIAEIAGIADEGEQSAHARHGFFPTLSQARGEDMKAAIESAKAAGDSVGGVVECAVFGLPAGVGGPLFDGLESRLSAALFAIPAVKGVEFGSGFALARMQGSESNDPFDMEEGRVVTVTNHCGGLLGGITTGMPLTLRAAFKPTPSIAKAQKSVNLETMQREELSIRGRHDPCVVPRAVPVVEAATAFVLCDALLGEGRMKTL